MVNFYGCTFMLYELSNPFVNLHWFLDKVGMTGSRLQFYNGMILLFCFFSCRLVWGTYQSASIYQDMWKARSHYESTSEIYYKNVENGTLTARIGPASLNTKPFRNDMMQFAGEEDCPLWIALVYWGSTIILDSLNFYWFGKMIDAVRRRFQPSLKEAEKEGSLATKSTGINDSFQIDLDETIQKRRVFTGDG